MARLATNVPRRRRPVPLRRPGAAAPAPIAPRTFSPFSAIYGPGGIVHEPSDSTAEKLAPGPGATRAAATTPPPSRSGGTSGDLTVPGYTPATPTGAPYNPSEPGHSAADFAAAFRARERREAHRRLERQLGTLTPLPAPTAPLPFVPINDPKTGLFPTQLAKAIRLNQFVPAEQGGRNLISEDRERQLLSKLPELPQGGAAIAQHAGTAQPVADRTVTLRTQRGPVSVPQSAIQGGKDPLGQATLGDATVRQLVAASQAGTLRQSKRGVLTTPENRDVLRNLLAAHQHYRQTARPGDLPFLSGEGEKNALTVLGIGAKRHESQKALLSAIETGLVESYGFENLKGGDADSEGWRQERTSIYGNQDPTNVRAGANNYFDEVQSDPTVPGGGGETSGQLAQTVQGSAYPERYAEHEAEAKEILQAFRQGQADPQAAQQLVQAKHAAVQHGINPTPWNGDVEGGDNEYVYVRADAKGAVNWARSALGTQEGSPKQLHWAELEALGPSEPWCADLVAVNLQRRGVPLPEAPNNTASYEEDWPGGTVIGTDISKAKPGDLVAYGHGAHIAMYVGDGKVIAGNWGDEVAEYGATEDSRGISAIVRPHYKGGRVKVKAGSLPGSSTESTFGGSVGGAVGGAPENSGGVPGEPTLASAGGRTPQQVASAEAALANFGVAPAPQFAASIREPEFGQPTDPGPVSAEQLLQLLGIAAATRV
jgi:hypothetical protein